MKGPASGLHSPTDRPRVLLHARELTPAGSRPAFEHARHSVQPAPSLGPFSARSARRPALSFHPLHGLPGPTRTSDHSRTSGHSRTYGPGPPVIRRTVVRVSVSEEAVGESEIVEHLP